MNLRKNLTIEASLIYYGKKLICYNEIWYGTILKGTILLVFSTNKPKFLTYSLLKEEDLQDYSIIWR